MHRWHTLTLCFATFQLIMVGSLQADESAPYWPRFHGPNGDNISTDTGLLKQWPAAGPELVWQAEGIGEGFASVSMADGLIYTAGNVDDRTTVTALTLEGELAWQTDVGPAWTKSYPGTRATPTYNEGRLYYETPLGDLVCLAADSGKQLWKVNILDKFDAQNITWALAESPVVDGDHLICCPFGTKGSVVALDKTTGETVWAAPDVGDRAGYATVTLAEFEGRRMILAMSAKALVGVAAEDGDLLFRYEHLTKYDVNALKPVYANGHVFISSGYGSGSELIKLNDTGDKIVATQVWKSEKLDNHHGGVVLLDGYVYGADSRRYWHCLDWDTGQVMYSERGVGKGSLTCADGMLYTLSENGGKVGLVEPTPEAHRVVSEFRIPEGGKGKSWAHPVVCGGRLYIRHGNFLFVYDVARAN